MRSALLSIWSQYTNFFDSIRIWRQKKRCEHTKHQTSYKKGGANHVIVEREELREALVDGVGLVLLANVDGLEGVQFVLEVGQVCGSAQ